MAAPLSELSPYASARHFFGAELRVRRLAVGLSQEQLGQKIFATVSMVNKVELARRFPSADFARRCDDVLNTDGALTRLYQLALAERTRHETPVDRPVILSEPEARALRRLLTAEITQVPTETSELMPDVLDRIDFVLATAGPPSGP
ncbi:multiprotein-bridging factor 1 family protein [Streptomyces griseoincarnatus]|uniref:helix-turn-helix domain-containing protein n=1 Tax=Promicromonospora sp. NPDC057138 TaxID=3346031 RepID=UPI003632DB6B